MDEQTLRNSQYGAYQCYQWCTEAQLMNDTICDYDIRRAYGLRAGVIWDNLLYDILLGGEERFGKRTCDFMVTLLCTNLTYWWRTARVQSSYFSGICAYWRNVCFSYTFVM